MSEIKSFRDLSVWKKSMDFVLRVYSVARGLPMAERYGLGDQLRRAVVSVPSNIAEGQGRDTAKDYTHFLTMARGSLNEVVTQLEIALRLGYVSDLTELYADADEIGRMLNSLIKRLRASAT